jgi:hypothetical protein
MAPQASEKMEFATGNGARTSEGFRGSGSGQPDALKYAVLPLWISSGQPRRVPRPPAPHAVVPFSMRRFWRLTGPALRPRKSACDTRHAKNAAFFWHPPNTGDRGGRREADPGRQKPSDSLRAGFCLQPYFQFPLACPSAARQQSAYHTRITGSSRPRFGGHRG